MSEKLTVELLVSAYSQGFFPMPDETHHKIKWYRPDPRAIIPLQGFHTSHSLKRLIKKNIFTVSFDTAFRQVMEKCSEHPQTWISSEFIDIYTELFERGFAHSVEIWEGNNLVGGVYGPSINGAFFGESMFHRSRDASKVALFHLVEKLKQSRFLLFEVQFLTPHLSSLGAIEISDHEYMQRLFSALKQNTSWE